MTVSRVANGSPNVEAATRQRVLEAMQQLGYRPNRMARALRSGQFRNVGVIVFDLNTFGNVHTLSAIAAASAAANYSLTLVSVQTPSQKHVTDAFARMEAEVVDGVIIVIDQSIVDRSAVQLPPGRPVVVIDSDPRSDYPGVDTDQRQGARLATKHLLDLGHSTVWHIGGPVVSYAAVRREEAWRATLTEAKREVPAVLRGDWTPESGYRAAQELMDRGDATAVFAANDQMALGALQAFHERGLRVPQDLSIVGFDNTPDSAAYWPALTTVQQHFDQVGKVAFDTLVSVIEGGGTPQAVSVPTTLIIRASTAAPPTR